ncbi:MAG: response regulator transcription factor [Nitrospinota bacterium]|nr:response regulator transcription factor [Nitrospinota bacterium]MDP7384749.1 response regulator transcription factor [Nitrospinota bacterium]
MRVLVVEDEAKVASFIARGLGEAGYTVDVAGQGPAALEEATVNDYDLILLDVMLPGIDGWEVLSQYREGGGNSPVMMLTARDAVEDKVRGLDSGADDYLTKPFALTELLARVRALLRREDRKTPVLRLADLELNPASREVRRAEKKINLSAREYALLEYFMRHQDRILSRSMVLEHVWDYSFDPETNVVDVYVSYLRNKIDRGFDPPLIHTMRGVGYRFGLPEKA